MASGDAMLDQPIGAHVDRGEVVGLAWLVAIGADVRRGAVGHLDVDRSQPVEGDTIFRISSMTKPITAAAALVLVDEGRVGLDDPVDEWLPELAARSVVSRPGGAIDDTVPAERAITVEDLLTFRLGLGGDFSNWDQQPVLDALGELGLSAGPPAPALPPEPDEWMRLIGTVPLQFQPGERWLYHIGADVLGVLIARVSGQPLLEFLDERIFEPLGMSDTGFFVPEAKLERFGPCFGGPADDGGRAVYDPPSGQWSTSPPFPGGGAGLVSTVGDYFAFADMLRHDGDSGRRRVLSPNAVRAMTANHLTPDQVARGPDPNGDAGWGYGVGVQLRARGGRRPGSYGWDGGLGSTWFNDPERDVVAIMMTNQMWTSPEPPAVCATFYDAITGLLAM